ncbi:hypothetical protein BD413DRAFT_496034 [Trametes elegans]|nr:hypothetical protein BD413DRAFT_496034 [Trametes elegans]
MFSTKLVAVFATLFAAAASVSAGTDKVIHPSNGEVWVLSQLRTIQWDTTDIPSTNATGDILLGYHQANSNDKHLDYDHPVAKDVPLLAGFVVVPVPAVEPRGDYFIQLFGSEDYESQDFIIKP